LVQANLEDQNFKPAFMLDQSHNITDPIESLIISAIETQRAFIQAHIVDREALKVAQVENDALMASEILKNAFRTDVTPILEKARLNSNGPIDPLYCYRKSKYRSIVSEVRPIIAPGSSGIV
jgi:L-rhamnose isomerase/sugar isomerase